MKILITGSSQGIGRACAVKFINGGHSVIGIDKEESTIEHNNYRHIVHNVLDSQLPEIENVNILINNVGVQDSGFDIEVNLKSTIRITEKYGIQPSIKSILFMASASARTGAEFPEYVASKAGMVGYMKNVAHRLVQYGATSNSLSAGGVISPLNKHILEDRTLYKAVLNETMLNKWATCEEIAEWTYFMTIVNNSMTGQDILVDNGEALKSNFIW